MKGSIIVLAVIMCACMVLGGVASAAAQPAGGTAANVTSDTGPQNPNVVVSAFQDVPNDGPFTEYLNNLYADGIVGGYTCTNSQPDLHCVPPDNKPYYRPGNAVTRLQMTKFIDLGRRSIADATGTSLSIVKNTPTSCGIFCIFNSAVTISSTAYNGIVVGVKTNGWGVQATCKTEGVNCYAVGGYGKAGTRGGDFEGGSGVWAVGLDGFQYGVYGKTTLAGSGVYGLSIVNNSGSAGVRARSQGAGGWSLFVDPAGPDSSNSSTAIHGRAYFYDGITINGGGCTGCAAQVNVQNVDGSALEVGDVVTIVGSAPSIAGDTPTITVKRASSAADSGVAGVIAQVLSVPDAAAKAAYERQEADYRDALERRNAILENVKSAANPEAAKASADAIQIPEMPANGKDMLVVPSSATTVAQNGYAAVVTSGSIPGVKVDASYGEIKAGDLLVASPHAGYAMKAPSSDVPTGAILGKALGGLEKGTGKIPMLVMMK